MKIRESIVQICEKIPFVQFFGAGCRFARANSCFSKASKKAADLAQPLLNNPRAQELKQKGRKELGRGFVALIPVFGSLILAIYDVFKKKTVSNPDSAASSAVQSPVKVVPAKLANSSVTSVRNNNNNNVDEAIDSDDETEYQSCEEFVEPSVSENSHLPVATVPSLDTFNKQAYQLDGIKSYIAFMRATPLLSHQRSNSLQDLKKQQDTEILTQLDQELKNLSTEQVETLSAILDYLNQAFSQVKAGNYPFNQVDHQHPHFMIEADRSVTIVVPFNDIAKDNPISVRFCDRSYELNMPAKTYFQALAGLIAMQLHKPATGELFKLEDRQKYALNNQNEYRLTIPHSFNLY